MRKIYIIACLTVLVFTNCKVKDQDEEIIVNQDQLVNKEWVFSENYNGNFFDDFLFQKGDWIIFHDNGLFTTTFHIDMREYGIITDTLNGRWELQNNSIVFLDSNIYIETQVNTVNGIRTDNAIIPELTQWDIIRINENDFSFSGFNGVLLKSVE